MTMRHDDPNQTRSIMSLIHNGMAVYDANGDRIGTVEDMYFGADADDPGKYGTGASTTGTPRAMVGGGLVQDVARALFDADRLPETLRNRLLNEGFIQIEPGTLLGGDMFATPDQIAGVTGDDVRLNVIKTELARE